MQTTKFRIYPDGTVVHENDFSQYDDPYSPQDDYMEVAIPDELLEYLREQETDIGR